MPEAYTEYWVRVAPYNPRIGNVCRRFGVGGSLYIGGEVPTWYLVTAQVASMLLPMKQPSGEINAPALFEIYTPDDRARVDAIENERRLAQLGLIAASAPIPPTQARVMDLTQDPKGVPVSAGREAAIPEGPASVSKIVAPEKAKEAPDSSGDLTTSHLARRKK